MQLSKQEVELILTFRRKKELKEDYKNLYYLVNRDDTLDYLSLYRLANKDEIKIKRDNKRQYNKELKMMMNILLH